MLVPLAVLGLHKAAIVWATVLLVTIASAYYGTAIIGGVVGDYLGATIQVPQSLLRVAPNALPLISRLLQGPPWVTPRVIPQRRLSVLSPAACCLAACLMQICELMIYLALLADWSVLSTGHSAWKPIALLFGTATLPIMYSRRIVDFGAKEC